MRAVPRFDPREAIAPGRTVIEASAGTGKTYTIAALVARLVADEDVPVDRILVVTFTKAATAELEHRIRSRLVYQLRLLESGTRPPDADEHVEFLLEGDDAVLELRRDRLAAALNGFDRSRISTIHGFAFQMLDQLGFHSRIPSGLEPVDIVGDLIKAAVADTVVNLFGDDATQMINPSRLEAIATAVTTNPDAVILPDLDDAAGRARVRAMLAGHFRTELARRAQTGGTIGYDQILIEARDALTNTEIGEHAAAVLERRFDVALVDESQDTDPIQWAMIRSIFDLPRRLIVIGDPKQSIYAFRGADIEAYLAVAEQGATERTLLTNWRSDGPLITALDALLDGVTFGDERIVYRPVEAAPGHEESRITNAGPPLQVRQFLDDTPGVKRRRDGYFSKPAARVAVAEDAAGEIVRMLQAGIEIGEGGAMRDLGPGDIAVLCRTRAQVQLVQGELDLRHVPSVAARSGSVFASPAAEEWRRFLRGIERPDRMTEVRLAAASDLVGMSLQELAALGDEEALDLQAGMRRWRTLLAASGFPSLFAAVDRERGLAARILARPDGERAMTDLTHLAEELHRQIWSGRVGSLLGWLEEQMVDALANEEAGAEEPESRQRRLETDAAAVQVQTIHGAKGLEFPVVMAPFLWDRPTPPQGTEIIPIFHEPDDDERPRPRYIDVGGREDTDDEEFRRRMALAEAEEDAEEARLLYVALTRARHHLVVWWIRNINDIDRTKLHEVMTRYPEELQDIRDRAGGTIGSVIVERIADPVRYDPDPGAPVTLERAVLDRTLDYEWRRESYSSLSPEYHGDGVPDTDAAGQHTDEVDDPDSEPGGSGLLPMAHLPRGLGFGNLVHHVLEDVPFDDPGLDGALVEATVRHMRRSTWEFNPAELAGALSVALHTPLFVDDGSLRLVDIPRTASLNEMRFEVPVRSDGDSVSLRGISRILARALTGDDAHRSYFEVLAEEASVPFRGFLTGSIDYLTALTVDGDTRYAVMDFKTNALMPLGGEPAATDYAPDRLAIAMEGGHYVLQSVLYQVALHRYLQWRLDGYEPSRRLGGSAYLFVRGMAGPDAPIAGGGRCGVYWWQPPSDAIVGLSRYLAGGGGP